MWWTSLQVLGKLTTPRLTVSTTLVSTSKTRLLQIFDKSTQLTFLIDTGSSYSIVPPTADEKITPVPNLRAANGSVINSYGTRTLTVDLGLNRQFNWLFLIADVTSPIIGADFLAHFNISVHLSAKIINDQTT